MTTELTPERLAELREVAEAATPGDWYPARRGSEVYTHNDHGLVAETWEAADDSAGPYSDTRHIAAFDPPTVLALLAEIQRLRAALEVEADAVPDVLTMVRDAIAAVPWRDLNPDADRRLGEANAAVLRIVDAFREDFNGIDELTDGEASGHE